MCIRDRAWPGRRASPTAGRTRARPRARAAPQRPAAARRRAGGGARSPPPRRTRRQEPGRRAGWRAPSRHPSAARDRSGAGGRISRYSTLTAAATADATAAGRPGSAAGRLSGGPEPARAGDGIIVRSTRGALPVSLPVGFPVSPPEPGVRLSAHRALHRPRWVSWFISCGARPWERDLRSPVVVVVPRVPLPGRTVPRPCRRASAVASAQLLPNRAPVLALLPPDDLFPQVRPQVAEGRV